ncbi:MAG: ubiquinone/menaquinone biosynthesis methyltransferase [Pontiellaceae bacterium]|nr:ubiquinone/menaquinone biosynthesis methyltransferase [Pontiellaceae bacterium]MBN2783441.1 ubiquinone/menaquinone biosynthesis methyltransferase [Pontiellaceae bacterium]
MNARFNLKPMEYINAPESKQTFNRNLFAEVAPKYDFITKALSFGRDAAWKRIMLDLLPKDNAPACVDLACGTGDITRMLADRYPGGKITGLDLTPEMLAIARTRTDSATIAYKEGSMAALPFETAGTDIVTGGYALRNAPDLNQTIDEITRILRPGGYAAFLDFSKPQNGAGQAVGHFLLKFWGGFWGLMLHGNPDVYGYIADSLKLYPGRTALRRRFEERGFSHQAGRRFFGGLLEAVVFRKDESHAA